MAPQRIIANAINLMLAETHRDGERGRVKEMEREREK